MKKIILAMVFVFATGTMMNANTSNEKEIKSVKNAVETEEYFGCASDCNSAAREGALLLSEDHSNRGAGGELMENYRMLYQSCYDANC